MNTITHHTLQTFSIHVSAVVYKKKMTTFKMLHLTMLWNPLKEPMDSDFLKDEQTGAKQNLVDR